MSEILVTGTTFIGDSHITQLSELGYSVDRLGKATASEDELIDALQGKVGYFLGGLEKITKRILESTDSLRAICFTGAAWTFFIPGHVTATKLGRPITSSPGANSQAVAEYAISLMHERVRSIGYLTGIGRSDRIQARNFADLTVGIVGAGNIGAKVGRILNRAYGCEILYASPSRKLDFEYDTKATRVSLHQLLENSDVVSFHMGKSSENKTMIGPHELSLIRDEGILINCSFAEAFDTQALLKEVSNGRLSVASDDDLSGGDEGILEKFRAAGPRYFIQSGTSTAYNTSATARIASDVATNAMISLLASGKHELVVNPEVYGTGRSIAAKNNS